MSAELTTLPSNGDISVWSAAEKAIMDAAGLVFTHTYGDRKGQREPAPRPVVERFLSLARRSGLDPLAGQIYCIGRLSQGVVSWSIQTGIDGFRVTAERSRVYDGQDPAEWLTEKGEWVDAFVPKLHGPYPLAARVKVYRSDWPRPAVGVAEWGAYAQTKANGELNAMWTKQGAGQLAKCAEALAIRKAFPQDLSGLYTSDEMGTQAEVVASAPASNRDWVAEITAATSHDVIEDLVSEADNVGEYTDRIRTAALTAHGMLNRAAAPAPENTVVQIPAAPAPERELTEEEYERQAAAEHAAAVSDDAAVR